MHDLEVECNIGRDRCALPSATVFLSVVVDDTVVPPGLSRRRTLCKQFD